MAVKSSALRWERLRTQVEKKLMEFPGTAGVAVVSLATEERFEANGDKLFPAASTIKVHLLAALVLLDHEGEVDLDEKVEVTERLEGSPILGCLEGTVELSWRDLANLMIVASDNTATNMIIDLVGYRRIAALLESLDLTRTVIKRKMKDFEAASQHRENLITPIEGVAVMERLWSGLGFPPSVQQECLRILKKPKKSLMRAALPTGVVLANKPGELPRTLNEIGIVYQPTEAYAVALMSCNSSDDSWEHARWFGAIARDIHQAMINPGS